MSWVWGFGFEVLAAVCVALVLILPLKSEPILGLLVGLIFRVSGLILWPVLGLGFGAGFEPESCYLGITTISIYLLQQTSLCGCKAHGSLGWLNGLF